MSDDDASEVGCCCASCGIAEVDDIKLKDCDDCDLVRYCSDECRNNHSSEHEEDCKKRAAELRDELLFKQPEGSHLGDCPICCLPLSLHPSKSTTTTCCSKTICNGCRVANQIREVKARLENTCPFCREPAPSTLEGGHKQRMKRVEANDPVAICDEGLAHYNEGEYIRAFEYFTKAAELGDAEAHLRLARMYRFGEGVEDDEGKENYHLEEAAIGGHGDARYLLACMEFHKGNVDRGKNHWMIAATQGHTMSFRELVSLFKEGKVSEDDLTAARLAGKAALLATKSQERDAAEAFISVQEMEGPVDKEKFAAALEFYRD